jgi:L,D-transpeptidase ErfK/SrfK
MRVLSLKTFASLCVFVIAAAIASPGTGSVYELGRDSGLIGALRTHIVQEGESLIELARDSGLGYNSIVSANPGVDAFVPPPGSVVTLPTFWILPDVKNRKGIVINLSEMRLYYFFSDEGTDKVMTFPIGIGREGFDTPTGAFKIIEKIKAPPWFVPESIRREKPELPARIPPGPENPLGSHALRLSLGTVLIHGTNKPWGVGRTVSHGCLRLYPEDIPRLFDAVPIDTKVAIVRQPVKIGVHQGAVYIEVHRDDRDGGDLYDRAVRLLKRKKLDGVLDRERLRQAVDEKLGFPLRISQ